MIDRFNLIRERTLSGSKLATLPVPEAEFWELVCRLTGPYRVEQVALLVAAPPLVEAQHVRGGLQLWVIERSVREGKPYRTATRVTPFLERRTFALTIKGARAVTKYLVLRVEGYQTVRITGGWAWSVRVSLVEAVRVKTPPDRYRITLDMSISLPSIEPGSSEGRERYAD